MLTTFENHKLKQFNIPGSTDFNQTVPIDLSEYKFNQKKKLNI